MNGEKLVIFGRFHRGRVSPIYVKYSPLYNSTSWKEYAKRHGFKRDAATKAKQKEYAEKHRRLIDVQYKVGDTALLQQKKTITKPRMTQTQLLSHTRKAPPLQPPERGR